MWPTSTPAWSLTSRVQVPFFASLDRFTRKVSLSAEPLRPPWANSGYCVPSGACSVADRSPTHVCCSTTVTGAADEALPARFCTNSCDVAQVPASRIGVSVRFSHVLPL